MPLSSVIGSSSIMQPGVCTSSTRPASPYDGQVIYETDTDRAMVWNGTSWVVLSTGRANSLGLDLVKTQTVGTAVSSVTVSDVFSATYDNYKIVYTGGISTAWTTLRLQIGASVTGYYYARTSVSYAGTAGPAGGANQTEFIYIGTAAPNTNSANIDVQSPYLAKRTVVTAQDAAAVTTGEATFTSGFLNDDTQHTSFKLFVSGHTLTGGTIYVYGYAKA